MNKISLSEGLISDIHWLSDGTLSVISGERNKPKLDEIRTQFLDFSQSLNPITPWNIAWGMFQKERK